MTDSPLRDVLESSGCPLAHMTVLADDPFRQDTPAKHRDARWLAEAVADLIPRGQKIHFRGLHYAVLGRTMPKGGPYTSVDKCWQWLSEDAAKAARWLGYVPWERFSDHRNDPPMIQKWYPPQPRGLAESTELLFYADGAEYATGELPGLERLLPSPRLEGFTPAQPYHLVVFGEKSSLEPVLVPLCRRYSADLYLPAGEISDTLLHTMALSIASNGVTDGRPMVVLTFSDCDPAGFQMPISIGRKLQAFSYVIKDMPEVQVHRVMLLPQHVRAIARDRGIALPDSPLKPGEARAGAWTQATGVAQIEVDALATLHRELFTEAANNALSQFFDATLERRAREAREQWEHRAAQVIEEQIGERLALLRPELEERCERMQADRDWISAALGGLAEEVVLPNPELPEAHDVPGRPGAALYDSSDNFMTATKRLLWEKSYGGRNRAHWHWRRPDRSRTPLPLGQGPALQQTPDSAGSPPQIIPRTARSKRLARNPIPGTSGSSLDPG